MAGKTLLSCYAVAVVGCELIDGSSDQVQGVESTKKRKMVCVTRDVSAINAPMGLGCADARHGRISWCLCRNLGTGDGDWVNGMSAYDMQGMVGDKGGRRVIYLTLIRRMGLDESTKKKKGWV
jgi:hypothetical protein